MAADDLYHQLSGCLVQTFSGSFLVRRVFLPYSLIKPDINHFSPLCSAAEGSVESMQMMLVVLKL